MGELFDTKANLIEAIACELGSGTEDCYALARVLAERIDALIIARIEAATGATS